MAVGVRVIVWDERVGMIDTSPMLCLRAQRAAATVDRLPAAANTYCHSFYYLALWNL